METTRSFEIMIVKGNCCDGNFNDYRQKQTRLFLSLGPSSGDLTSPV